MLDTCSNTNQNEYIDIVLYTIVTIEDDMTYSICATNYVGVASCADTLMGAINMILEAAEGVTQAGGIDVYNGHPSEDIHILLCRNEFPLIVSGRILK